MNDTHRALVGSLANFVLGFDTVEDTLRSVMNLSVETIPAADMAGVSMLGTDLKPTTHVFTDERALVIDEAQYMADSGPCLDSWRQNRVITIHDVDKARADYPVFVENALGSGVGSTLSVPLRVAGSTIGAMNLYSGKVDSFSEADEQVAGDVASVVATIMVTTTYSEALELNLHLTRAIESRAVIEQAKGIIMASARCSPDKAFALLSQQSQTENRKVREIAEEIVRNHSR